MHMKYIFRYIRIYIILMLIVQYQRLRANILLPSVAVLGRIDCRRFGIPASPLRLNACRRFCLSPFWHWIHQNHISGQKYYCHQGTCYKPEFLLLWDQWLLHVCLISMERYLWTGQLRNAGLHPWRFVFLHQWRACSALEAKYFAPTGMSSAFRQDIFRSYGHKSQ